MKDNPVSIAVLSGKGGTGKTLVAVNLAAAAREAVYMDCDVEEPNGHLFFKPEGVSEENVSVRIPFVHESLCTGCKRCAEFCRFNAIAVIKNKPVFFEEVCHSCGGCRLVCPERAVVEKEKTIGRIQKGRSQGIEVKTGILNTGEASGIPIIKKLLAEKADDSGLPVFIDCPPGSACIVMESLKDADYCILVAEPTIFGVHNLNMVFELVSLFQKRFAVVLNKCIDGRNPAREFCLEKGIPILGAIPFDSELGLLNSNAEIAARQNEKYGEMFAALLETVMKEARR